jgi:hypothetical protein
MGFLPSLDFRALLMDLERRFLLFVDERMRLIRLFDLIITEAREERKMGC